MSIDARTSLAELVTAHPSLARVLERHELDYCCGGAQALDAACRIRRLDVGVVVRELEQALDEDDAPVWTTMGPAALVDHIEQTHHRYLWSEMPRVSELVDKIVSVHGGRHPELAAIRSCWEEIRADLEPHLTKEERVLFPAIRRIATEAEPPTFPFGSINNPVSVMVHEHDRVGELLAQMRHLTEGYVPPADGCASYRSCFAALEQFELDTHLHVHKENNVLFPMVTAADAELAPIRP